MVAYSTLLTYCQLLFNRTATCCKASIKNPTEKNIHDLRVSFRRLLTVLDFVLFLYDSQAKQYKALRKIRKEAKSYFKSLSPLRDLQVQLLNLEKSGLEEPVISDILVLLRKEEDRVLRKLPKTIRKWELIKLSRKFMKVFEDHVISDREIEMKTYLYTHFLTDTMHRKINGTTEDPATYHRVRVALKKYRYFLEFLDLGFNLKQGLLPYLKSWQERLGNLQDLTILIKQLENFDVPQSYDLMLLKKKVGTEIDESINVLNQDIYELKFKTQY